MSDTPWTDGKWTTTPDGQHVGIEDDFADGHNWMSICQVFTHSLVSPSQMKANAHLIAAAPELAEALEKLLVWFDGDRAGWILEENAAALSVARAALAKARGGTP